MLLKEHLIRLSAIVAMACFANTASACMMCTSNLSYNMMRFSALWLGLFLVWIIGLAYLRLKFRTVEDISVALKPYLHAFLKYAIFLLILYVVTGFHLVAILVFPLILVFQWKRRSSAFKAANFQLWKLLRSANFLLGGAMAVAVPVGYFLPGVISEPETRVRHQQVLKSMKMVLDSPDPAAAAAEAVDPYNYTQFKVPVYNLLMQGTVFFRPRDTVGFQVTNVNGKTIVYSRGPNGVFDLSPGLMSKTMGETSDTTKLGPYTYDATNGMIGTAGDIWVAR